MSARTEYWIEEGCRAMNEALRVRDGTPLIAVAILYGLGAVAVGIECLADSLDNSPEKWLSELDDDKPIPPDATERIE